MMQVAWSGSHSEDKGGKGGKAEMTQEEIASPWARGSGMLAAIVPLA